MPGPAQTFPDTISSGVQMMNQVNGPVVIVMSAPAIAPSAMGSMGQKGTILANFKILMTANAVGASVVIPPTFTVSVTSGMNGGITKNITGGCMTISFSGGNGVALGEQNNVNMSMPCAAAGAGAPNVIYLG